MVTLYANKIIRLVHATLCDGPQSRFSMVQIKISVAFVLATVATAIAPVVASPVSTLKNGSVLYDVIDDYFFLIVYCSAELNARDDSEMLERSFEHVE